MVASAHLGRQQATTDIEFTERDKVEVYINRTWPLIGACTQRYPLLVLKCADLRNLARFANIETNFINASEPDESPSIGTLYGMAGTAIHENIHTSFQHQLRGYNANPSPVWFT